MGNQNLSEDVRYSIKTRQSVVKRSQTRYEIDRTQKTWADGEGSADMIIKTPKHRRRYGKGLENQITKNDCSLRRR